MKRSNLLIAALLPILYPVIVHADMTMTMPDPSATVASQPDATTGSIDPTIEDARQSELTQDVALEAPLEAPVPGEDEILAFCANIPPRPEPRMFDPFAPPLLPPAPTQLSLNQCADLIDQIVTQGNAVSTLVMQRNQLRTDIRNKIAQTQLLLDQNLAIINLRPTGALFNQAMAMIQQNNVIIDRNLADLPGMRQQLAIIEANLVAAENILRDMRNQFQAGGCNRFLNQ